MQRAPDDRNLTYAGIGSRRAPAWALELAERAAEALREQGWTLRSGHALGMDQAWERGAGRDAEHYLPWASFEMTSWAYESGRVFEEPIEAAYEMAAEYHPNWHALKRGGRALQARNCHQVLGRDLASPVAFVACWTPDGSLDGRGPDTGGTGQALRIAVAHSIPVFNLAVPEHRLRIERFALTAA